MEKKKIFISDIHMGDHRSLCPGNSNFPYSLLSPPSTNVLENFLEYIYKSEDISELVILGDLMDTWSCPTSIKPIESYQSIVESRQNRGIIEALKSIASSGRIKLSISKGCHDSDLSPQFLKDTFPGVNILFSQNDSGSYIDKNIVAEHGSKYSLFCSTEAIPDSAPPGYYIARILSENRTKNGRSLKLPQIIAAHVRKHFKGRCMVEDTFRSILDFCKLPFETEILIRNSDKSDSIDVPSIVEKFRKLFRDWNLRKDDRVDAFTGLITDTIGLSEAAHKVHFNRNKDIVIMGHTHEADIKGYIHSDTFADSFSENLPCKRIYANTGSWINGLNNHTYIETYREMDENRVKLFRFTGSRSLLLKERYTETLSADTYLSARQLGV